MQYPSYQFSYSLAGPLHYGCPTFIVLSLHLSAFPDSALPGSFWLLGEFISLWLYDDGPHFLVHPTTGMKDNHLAGLQGRQSASS